MGHLMGFLRQRLVVEAAGGFWVQREVELIFPAEFETGAGERVVAQLCRRMPLGDICGVSRDLVGDDAYLHAVAVGKPQMLLGS